MSDYMEGSGGFGSGPGSEGSWEGPSEAPKCSYCGGDGIRVGGSKGEKCPYCRGDGKISITPTDDRSWEERHGYSGYDRD